MSLQSPDKTQPLPTSHTLSLFPVSDLQPIRVSPHVRSRLDTRHCKT